MTLESRAETDVLLPNVPAAHNLSFLEQKRHPYRNFLCCEKNGKSKKDFQWTLFRLFPLPAHEHCAAGSALSFLTVSTFEGQWTITTCTDCNRSELWLGGFIKNLKNNNNIKNTPEWQLWNWGKTTTTKLVDYLCWVYYFGTFQLLPHVAMKLCTHMSWVKIYPYFLRGIFTQWVTVHPCFLHSETFTVYTVGENSPITLTLT